MFDGIFEALHQELDELNAKFAEGAKMSVQELEHIDKMAHALKSLKAYEAMLEGCGGKESSYSRMRKGYRW